MLINWLVVKARDLIQSLDNNICKLHIYLKVCNILLRKCAMQYF